MAKNVMSFKLENSRLVDKYKDIVYKDDAFESTILFNRIMDGWQVDKSVFDPIIPVGGDDQTIDKIKGQLDKCLEGLYSEEKAFLILRQVTVYGRLNAHGMEIDNLLKVLTYENFCGFDSIAVLNRLTTFFGFMMGIDVFDYYLNFFKIRFPNDKRLKNIGKPIENKQTKNIHFVDSGIDSYNAVLSKMVQGDYKGAIGEIGETAGITEKDFKVKNLEVAMLLSMGAKLEASKILDELDNAGCRDVEFFANLYQLSKLNQSVAKKAIKMIEIDEKLKTSYDLKVILASLYVIEKEYKKAILVLSKITGVKKDGREVLKLLAECYYCVGEKEKLNAVLRRVVALYPYDIWARFYLVYEDFNLEKNINKFEPEVVVILKKYIKDRTSGKDAFNNLDRRDAIFIFKALEEVRESILSKEVIEKIYNSKHREILFDALISVQTDLVTSQIILQVLIEQDYRAEFYALKDCELTKFNLKLPESLLKCDIEKDKNDFLISCYAQTYSLMFYLGFDLFDIEGKLNEIIEILKTKELLKDTLLYRAECVVFLLANALHFKNEYIDQTFKKMKRKEKDELLEILKNMK